MGIDAGASPQAASSDLAPGPRLDRRRFVQGALVASLAGAAGGVRVLPAVARDAGETGRPSPLLGTAVDRGLDDGRFSLGDWATGACLEASLHVMME